MHFKDKVIWITGASSGIGEELAVQLARQEAKLIVTARNLESLLKVQEKCLVNTSFCKIVQADLSAEQMAENAVGNALQQFGNIDIVILNAGVTQRSLAIETNITVYKQLMGINFFAPLIITQKLLPYFKQQQSGHIVAISSVAGLMGFPLRSGYAASKHALMGYFETLQTEKPVKGLKITIVSPGRINTDISLAALTKDGAAHQQKDKGQLNGIPVNICAAKILTAIKKNKKHIIIARGEYLLWMVKFFFPNLYYKIANKKGLEQQ